jgi:hypothetical protein
MLSSGLKSKTYSLRNETEELVYILKLKNGAMGEKNDIKSSLVQRFQRFIRFTSQTEG